MEPRQIPYPSSLMKLLHPSVLFLAFMVFPWVAAASPEEVVLELESSDDMIHWNSIDAESISKRDGKIRFKGPASPFRFFRIKIADPEWVARQKLKAFRNFDGPPLIPEDFTDMRIEDAHSSIIDDINTAIRAADESQLDSPELLQQIVSQVVAAQTDPDAVGYANRTGLRGVPLLRLSGFLKDLKAAGIAPALMYLGRQEFLGRDGNIHYAVYGNPANVGPGIMPRETGIGFTGDDSTFVFQTPDSIRSATAPGVGIYVVAKRTSANLGMALLSHNPRAGSDRGPELSGTAAYGAYQTQMTAHPSGTANTARSSAYACAPEGVFYMPFGEVANQGGSLHRIPGGGLHIASGSTLASATVYHNNANGALGAPLSNTAAHRWRGEISFALETAMPLGTTRRYQLLNALCKHGIASLAPPSVVFLVGDSMTVGSAGAGAALSRSSLLFTVQDSGWRGSVWESLAQGGVPVATQEIQYAEAISRLSLLPDVAPGYIWFWGGYNPRGDYDSNAQTIALADRYLAMAADAASRGIRTVHWSTIVSNPSSQEMFNRIQLFNNYYKEQLALLEGEHIYYDHRETFNQGQFDGSTRNEAYFADPIHLTELGQQVLVDDFLSKHPSPAQ
jgi:hypothetical protein